MGLGYRFICERDILNTKCRYVLLCPMCWFRAMSSCLVSGILFTMEYGNWCSKLFNITWQQHKNISSYIQYIHNTTTIQYNTTTRISTRWSSLSPPYQTDTFVVASGCCMLYLLWMRYYLSHKVSIGSVVRVNLVENGNEVCSRIEDFRFYVPEAQEWHHLYQWRNYSKLMECVIHMYSCCGCDANIWELAQLELNCKNIKGKI